MDSSKLGLGIAHGTVDQGAGIGQEAEACADGPGVGLVERRQVDANDGEIARGAAEVVVGEHAGNPSVAMTAVVPER